MGKLRKLLRLNLNDWCSLALAVALLPLTALMLWLTGLRRCLRVLAFFTPDSSALESQKTEVTLDYARCISRLVNVAVRYGIYPANCLQRSLVLWWLLHRRGIQSELHIGTRKEAGRLDAHAWIELAGVALNDSDDVRLRYIPFDRAITLVRTGRQ